MHKTHTNRCLWGHYFPSLLKVIFKHFSRKITNFQGRLKNQALFKTVVKFKHFSRSVGTMSLDLTECLGAVRQQAITWAITAVFHPLFICRFWGTHDTSVLKWGHGGPDNQDIAGKKEKNSLDLGNTPWIFYGITCTDTVTITKSAAVKLHRTYPVVIWLMSVKKWLMMHHGCIFFRRF